MLGIHHEQQHQELILTDLKYVLSLNPFFPVYHPSFELISDHNAETGWINVPGGIYEIGHEDAGFCFDNETPAHLVHLPPYRIASRLVRNGDWLAFIDDDERAPPDWLRKLERAAARYEADGLIARAIDRHGDYIKREILALDLRPGREDGFKGDERRLDEERFWIGLKKA